MILKYEELDKISLENPDKKIVFCLGVFDLTHAGHILFFEDCKSKGDILVTGVAKDSFIKKYKGDLRPILNENIRLKTVSSLKPVDYAFLDESEKWVGKESHETTLRPIFQKLRPHLYVVNEDAVDLFERKRIADQENVEMIILPRYCPEEFEQISTTKIISKIKELG